MYNSTYEGNTTIGQILEIIHVNTTGNVSNIDSTDTTLNVTFASGNLTPQHFVYVPSGIASRPSAGPSLTNADGTTRNNSSGSEISQDGVTYNGTCVPMIDYDITQTDCNGEGTPTRPMMRGNYLAVPNPGSNVYVVNKQLNPQANENNNHKRKCI
ncbi:hypothetical protein KUTeg_008728 [Tegillarca granosa]|uniref:Uncharacterized protein n=1 Tax=Tegillarca granosa TaxID=220873 RepID=A0ABQ9FA00_TEGGR|nr:hypothetical protein KUTeg_008728 [Tegillarca granosa]